MKGIKIFIAFILPLFIYPKGIAQTLNWNALQDSKHIIIAGIGWDYSISYSLGYAYQLKTKVPIVLTTNFSTPSGEKLLDDFKTKIGGQILILNEPNLKGSIALNGIHRRYENPLVRLQNVGSELKGTLGYYKPKWFVAGEVVFDNAIVTYFKHSETFKESIFTDVKDGWYEPSTEGNFQYGIQTGYSFNKSDITLNIGMITTQDFKTTPLIPYYLMLGYNHRIN
ncbi:hypothetical protein [Membranihabitans maritimus]|uniref:hypothetical protein n=1 Tax=Membranihabitans maritimus TaxID=2904244 RepID=UPI001F190133|nr:hypothetical protein [Membranihabitans maritimus]